MNWLMLLVADYQVPDTLLDNQLGDKIFTLGEVL